VKGVFITATGTDIGKTHVACGLLRESRTWPRPLTPRKPVVSDFDPEDWRGSDPGRLMEAAGLEPSALDDVAPLRFRAPLAPTMAAEDEGRRYTYDDVVRASRGPEPVLVEGVGGVLVPWDDRRTVVDLIADLDLPSLLVAGSYLGTISHTLTAWEVLTRRTRTPRAVVVSESAASTVSLDRTVELLRPWVAPAPLFVVRRDRDDFAELGEWCRDIVQGPTSVSRP
jgi:dethiobiotin synthetase